MPIRAAHNDVRRVGWSGRGGGGDRGWASGASVKVVEEIIHLISVCLQCVQLSFLCRRRIYLLPFVCLFICLFGSVCLPSDYQAEVTHMMRANQLRLGKCQKNNSCVFKNLH